MDVQQAVSLPHFVNRFGTYDLEAGTKAAGMTKDLQALGYQTKIDDQNSGLHGIEITPSGIIDRLSTFDEYLEDERVKALRAEMYGEQVTA